MSRDTMRNSDLTDRSRELRNNMTREEKHLWYDFLRSHPLKFRRQRVVGHYITDFYSPVAKTAIEVDGSQHYDPAAMLRDSVRTEYIEKFDIEVVRVPNNEVRYNFHGVCVFLDNFLHDRTAALYDGRIKVKFLVEMPDVVRQWLDAPPMDG